MSRQEIDFALVWANGKETYLAGGTEDLNPYPRSIMGLWLEWRCGWLCAAFEAGYAAMREAS